MYTGSGKTSNKSYTDKERIDPSKPMKSWRFSVACCAQTSQYLRVFGHIIRKELQSDEAVEACVLRLIHHTHAAATESF